VCDKASVTSVKNAVRKGYAIEIMTTRRKRNEKNAGITDKRHAGPFEKQLAADCTPNKVAKCETYKKVSGI
jgi:hypothetical protein